VHVLAPAADGTTLLMAAQKWLTGAARAAIVAALRAVAE
jgi:hypothetical protein